MRVVRVGGAVGLVPHQDHRLAAAAQDVGNVLVERGHAGAHVDELDADVRLGDGQARLLLGAGGQHGQPGVVAHQVAVQAGGVDHGEAPTSPFGDPVQPVAGQAGELVDDRVALPGEAVEERRLANVRATHDRHDPRGLREVGLVGATAAARTGARRRGAAH